MRRRNQISTEVRIGPSDLRVMCGIDAAENFTFERVRVDEYGCVVVTFTRQDEVYKSPHVNTVRWPKRARLWR